MKISGFIKSFPILSFILISTVTLGLFYSYESTSEHHDLLNDAFSTPADADTVRDRNKNHQDSVFNALMVSADNAMSVKNYEKCLTDLEKALLIKPGNQVLKDRLTVVRGLFAEQKQQNEASQKAIASGDAYFKAKDYLNAKSAYQLAAGLNPNDQVAKEKLQKTLDLLRSQKAQNILFDVAISSADKLFQAGDYVRAQQEYENASKLLPGDPYPKNKINEIIKILVDKQVKDEEFAKAVSMADKFYLVKNYPSALIDYKKANIIKPEEKYPQEKIKELTDILAAQKAKDEAYLKAITLADQYYKDIQYPEAIKTYTEAIAIKPDQTYPKEKIKEIEGILTRNSNAQADYDKYIALADSFYVDKMYLKARENYLMATSVKPSESYPKEMLSKADKMLTGQEAILARALDEQYAKTIADADKLLTDLNYEPARAAYSKASNLKPGEKYPKDKIQEIDKILANAVKDKEQQYQLAIATADRAFANKVYETANVEFHNALTIKPNENYPKLKIAEIDKLIAAELKQKAADAKYTNAIARADSLLFIKIYLPAKAEFQNALKMKPTEVYPKSRIAEIDLALADLEKQKALDNQYAVSIAKADKMLADKSYVPARSEYSNALKLKQLESYPKEKIAEIDNVLADLAAAKALDEHYVEILAGADKLFASKTFDQARLAYQNAGNLKPLEQYPKDKVSEIDKILADIAARNTLEENYKATIAKADQYLSEKTYEPAKAEYTNASVMKPLEQYPKTKIAEIEAIFAANAKQKAMEEEYAATISRADKLLTDKSYEPALAEYQGALKIKPTEVYPKGKIDEITLILADFEKQKSLEAQYAGLVAKADKLLTEKSYIPARTEYSTALSLKPLETYPKDKIAEIDKILADIAAAKALDDKYNEIIAGADKLFVAKTYDQARTTYLKAGSVKPSETYPQEKIAEIDKIFADISAAKSLDENYKATIANADKILAEKKYKVAKEEYTKAAGLKPTEKYPVAKIAEIDAILAGIKDRDDKYAASIASADQMLLQKSYSTARTEYLNASSIKPQESYPKEKIAGIDVILAGIAAAKALDDKYTGIIAGADKLFATKTYDQARSGYQNAGSVKPDENYPKEKIAEIDKILADIAAMKILDGNYNAAIAKADQLLTAKSYDPAKSEYIKASELKPAEQYPKTKIAEIDATLAAIAKQKALDDEYAATIVSADKLLAGKTYELAKAEYLKAGALKPTEQYPKTKLAEIEKALTDVAHLKAIDDQYAAAIAGADKLFQGKNYDEAKTAYLEAGKIKPAEQYPQSKILEINDILAAIAKQKALDEQYKILLTKADQLLVANAYDEAKADYTNALNLKPSEQYPKEKISEIDKVLAELKAKEDAYKAVLAAGDQLLVQKKYEEARTEYQNSLVMKPQATYPKEKIAEINKALEELLGKQKYYENLVSNADNLFKDKDYEKAKETYQQALGLFPAQPYPKERIDLITARVDSLYRANKSRYDIAVADGDRFYNSFEFDKAVDAYTEAVNFLPMEKYPREMILKIRKAIAENAIADVLKTSVMIMSNTEKQFSFTPVNITARKNNFVYVKIRNLSGKPFNVLMRYGENKQANGGVVMRNLNPDGKVIERLISVRDQDLWSRENNNWIGLYPQGGDIEVSFIQVSRAK